jgi:HAD superfamily hydrolase (TIGR01490 family)
VRPADVDGAAFFDVDRTLLSHSSSLALAPAFRERGLISRLDVAKAAVAQLVFVRFGAGHSRTGRTAERGVAVLEGVRVDTVRELVAEAVESLLKPYVYREALDLVAEHAARGERAFLVSAGLQEVVEALAEELGVDGGIGSRAEVVDGVYSGRLARRLYGPEKAAALRELASARGIELAASAAYSDSVTDLPFLEAVGHPVAVNPDRRLARVAEERGWTMRRFRDTLGSG